MKPVAFDDAETYEPEDGWRRVSMAGSDQFSFEWFEKPPGHSSPMHDHENEQVCLCLEGGRAHGRHRGRLGHAPEERFRPLRVQRDP